MFAEVILHRRVPSKFESFTYSVPSGMTVEPGQLVSVPFKQQKISGIVRRLHENAPRFPTRDLLETHALFLEPWQMELAESLSREYGSSLGPAINLFLPKNIWDAWKADGIETSKTLSINSSLLRAHSASAKQVSNLASSGGCRMKHMRPLPVASEAELTKLIKKIIQASLASDKPKLILEHNRIPRDELLAALIEAAPNSQILYLVPEMFALKKLEGAVPMYHGGLSEKEKARIWHAVRTGKVPIIAGTRAALFLPFQNLRCIVLDSEENESYQEKRQPAYFAPKVAERIADLKKIPLITVSAAPRVETWHKAAIGDYEKIEFSEAAGKPSASKVVISDMNDERRKGNTGIFAERTMESMTAALSQDRQVLLFVNRKGEGSALFCLDCREVARCPSCSSAYTVYRGGLLKCHRCRTSRDMPEHCASCRGMRLKSIGAGTQKLESEIKKIFGRASVLRLDRETAKNGASPFDEKELSKADIIVATKIIEKPIYLERLALTAYIAADGLLAGQDFRSAERAWQLLTHLRQLTRGEFIIQTSLPEHRLFRLFAEDRMEDFYKEELSTRRNLNLPPFNVTVKGEG